ncbi:MAG: CapA family protein [Thermoleophilia bacterium]
MPSDAEAGRRRRERRAARRRAVRRRRIAAVAVLAGVAVAVTFALRGLGSDGASQATATANGEQRADAAPPAKPLPDATPITVSATGDIVMGSLPYGLPSDGGRSFFTPVKGLLTGDVVLGNLEGTLATGGSSKCGAGSTNCYAFRTPPSYATWLKAAGFTVMNLANNHAYDFGATGQRETVAALDRVGLLNTGRPNTQATVTAGGQRVAILGFAPYRWADSLLDIPRAKRRVQAAARTAQIVIVTMHAGAEGSDRTSVPRGPETFLGEQRGDSRAFTHAVIDAGADLVIGSGPHVLRGMEIYRGRLIAYSLGNFGGYKVFSLGGPLSTSAVLQATLRPDGRLQTARIRPTRLVGAGTPAPGGSAISTIRTLSQRDFGSRAPVISADGTITAR